MTDAVRLAWLLHVVAIVGSATPTQAQPLDTRPSLKDPIAIGLWLGGESLPNALDPGCAYTSETRRVGVNTGGRVRVPVSNFAIEGRVIRHWRCRVDCTDILIPLPEGTHTTRLSALASGGFTSTDVRATAAFGDRRMLFVSLGSGWVWTKKIPVVTSSVGMRLGDQVRWIVSGDFDAYHAPFELVTADYMDGRVTMVRRIARTRRWVSRVGMHVGVEVPFAR